MQLRHRPWSVVVVLTASVALGVASCTAGGSGDGEPSPITPEPTSSSARSEEPTASPDVSASPTGTSAPGSTDEDGTSSAPAFPADTSPDAGDAAGGDVGTLSDLRLGAHEGYDRVVFELDGPGTPGWQVRYVDAAIGDPSGLPVEVTGEAVLEVTLFPVALPDDGTDPYDGPSTMQAAGTTSVTEVVWNSLFEGYLQAFVGVDGGRQPFRAYALSDPARIVVDVRSP